MPVNTLLIRWWGGWTEASDAASVAANGRVEAFLLLGAVQTEAEAQAIAAEQLVHLATERESVEAEVEPDASPSDTLALIEPGDVITAPESDLSPSSQRVMAVTLNEDENGYLSITPELKDVLEEVEERFAARVKKLANGSMDQPPGTPMTI